MRAWVIVAVTAVLTWASLSCATMPAAPAVTREGVRFELVHPEARSVTLAGSFNQWSTSSHPLSRRGSSGAWSVVVALPPGEHLFMYVVDGSQWISPPLADDFADDGFGARNGVVVVRPDR
jgi:1,4-alpha-glucan branching enzyme